MLQDFIVVNMSEGFLLTNKIGGYTLLFDNSLSRYYGVFFFQNNKMFKTIHHFEHNSVVKKTINYLWSVQRVLDNGLIESFSMPLDYDALVYELNRVSEFDLFLDCKNSYDNRSWGRNYEINKESGCVVIHFSKINDIREDIDDESEYDFYLAIFSKDFGFEQKNDWQELYYDVDKKRSSEPFSRWIYNAGKLKGKNFVFAFSKDKKQAIKTARFVFDNNQKLIKEKQDSIYNLLNNKLDLKKQIKDAYYCAINSLDSLTTNDQGLFAGLPWFFQFWARDEAISCKALISQERFDLAKKILFRHLNNIDKNGKIKNFSEGNLYAADAIGWIFLRLEELFDKQKLSSKEIDLVNKKLELCIKKDLIFNDKNETWMDTNYNDDGRNGYRIEIQALNLAMLRFYKKLSGKDFETDFKKKVVKAFLKDDILLDGINDKIIMPNVFIAAYVYPELLTEKQWIECFDKVLPKLWLKWGGLSSIDKNNKLFVDEHTGQDNKSYHRGDSWFWINNLAAIVLYRLDKKRYKKYIDQIIEASVHEILFSGVVGHHAELSSAKELRSEGCLSQAWSSAMFIELIEEVYR